MKKTTGVFGLLFLLFWAIPFPMIMYYRGARFYEGSSPGWALLYLAVSLFLWLLLFYRLFRGLVLNRFIAIRNLNNLMRNGELKTAKIIQSTPLTQEYKGIDKYQLILELQNFVGTTIHEKVTINDDKPFLKKYEAGKTVQLRIDKKLKNTPYLQLDGAHYNPPTPRGLILGTLIWLALLSVAVWYFLYAYQHENNGTGWRFLVFYHPLILCPLILLGVGLLVNVRTFTANQLQHKYYGYETQAAVTGVSQTGVYINNKPQVRFDLQYTDRQNRLNNVSFKRTLGVLDAGLAQQKTIDIFYLDSDPQNICLASELDS